ncbi:MAG TPA: CHAD domain-containing protein [Vicinamibacteria bacterium]|nr:CHAD domain-containing protein [Vicinamibacteria bacterium]
MRLARGLLERSPEETSRRLCFGLLGEGAEALDRLGKGDDEALHDFRVSLRRLRSAIRAYRPFLKGSNPRKLRKRLAAMAASTNVARDAEVQIGWLEKAGVELEEAGSRAAAQLRDELASRQEATPSTERLRKEFDAARKSLERAFRRMRLDEKDTHPSFLSATGHLLAERGSTLQRTLEMISSSGDIDKLHGARIEAKRLRYLLEPLRHDIRGAGSIVRKMKTLQDCLGDLQDARVLTETIASALERAAVDKTRRLREKALGRESDDEPTWATEAGLHVLLEAQQKRREDGFAELSHRWLGKAAGSFFEEVFGLASRLTARSMRKRFLLSSVPESLARRTAVTIRQGFLPGRKISEHVRSEQRGRRTRFFRVVDVAGQSVEESISRERFDAFWSLTDGNRLEHSRYDIDDDGSGSGHVDVVAGSETVLAECESVPEWLQPFVVREVTRIKSFEPEALARARSAPETLDGPEASTQ